MRRPTRAGRGASAKACFPSLWKQGEPLFAGRHYAGLSKMALHAIGGILRHGRALAALEADHDFLRPGDVFSDEVIGYWIKYKRENELTPLAERPHPYEFCMYFDV